VEERLRKLERWLATTLRSIGDAVIATDTRGRITYLNACAEMVTGWTLNEALGRPWQEVFQIEHGTTGASLEDVVERALQEGIVINLNEDSHLVTKAGRRMPVDDSVAPVRDDQGEVTGCVIVFRDATERRQMETELRRFNQQLETQVAERTAELEAANKALVSSNAQLQAANKELESFSCSISHDLRAPLRAINGFARMLKEKHGHILDEGGQRFLKIIDDSSRTMGEMIDGFLALASVARQEPVRQLVDMQQLVQRLVEERQHDNPNAAVRFEVAPLPEAIGDRSLLRQVWANLLDNALKFSAGRQPAVIEIGGRAGGDQNHYFVRDNGVGFDMEYADRLFGVFQRLHSAREFTGYGLGLANVQRIVRRHGGRVWAESEPGKGATFHFTLPLAESNKQP
jgi:PAS domain S-box-containing protein